MPAVWPPALEQPALLAGLPAQEDPEISVLDRFAATALGMMRLGAGVMGGVIPGEARIEWRELANKLHAFEWFTFAGWYLDLGAGEPAPLIQQARWAAAMADAYTGLWAMEGLGYLSARGAGTGAEGLPPHEVLAGKVGGSDHGRAGGEWAGLPERAMVPLSTGSALAMAERLLADLERGGGGADQALVRGWLERCCDGVHPGFRELAVEALGLVARTLQPWRLARLDTLLAAADPPLAEFLWHGAGRGLYFAPMHLPPWSGGCRRAFGKAWSESPHDAGRRNATAGLAWALTLVNVRSPEVAEACLACCGGEPDAEQAVANGASSALLVWRQWAGADRLLDRFLAYQPAAAGRAHRWRRQVIDPSRAALAGSPPALRRHGHLAGLFRFQVAS